MWDILTEIWELPWHKVLVIAVLNDAILFVKIWPAFVVLIVIWVSWYLWAGRLKSYYRRKKKARMIASRKL